MTATASADPTPADRAKARAMMEQGDAAFDKKDYTAALQAYQAAHAIMSVPTTGLAVAQALAGLGQIVEAYDTAVLVTQMPARRGEPHPFTVARGDAEKLVRELTPRLGALSIGVEGASDIGAVAIDVDGTQWPGSALGQPRHVNPGAHQVHASADGYLDDQKAVSVGEGQTVAVSLVLRRKEPPPEEPAGAPSGPAGSNAVAVTQTTAPTPATTSPEPEAAKSNADSSFWSGQRVTAAVVAGAGIAGMVTGSALALGAKAKYDGATGCDAMGCDSAGYEQRQSARSQGTVASVVFGIGAGALAASVVLWLTAPSRAPVTVALGPARLVATVGF